MRQVIAVTFLAWGVAHSPSPGQLIKFEQKAAWLDTMSGITEIPFTGFPKGTDITDQYEDLGVLFVDNNDFVIHSELIFPQDHWGASEQLHARTPHLLRTADQRRSRLSRGCENVIVL